MKYMGSKNRIAKKILPIILYGRKSEQYYIEPFCGGLNVMDKVRGNCIANDNNKYLIAMWKGLQKNRKRPYRISKELYTKAKQEYKNKINNEFDDFLLGWIGWMASFNGKFFDGGYSGHCAGKTKRDYIGEQIRNTERQIEKIKHVKFKSGDYAELDCPYKSIIYCDIPYKNTTKYSTSKRFDYDRFWNWCRDMVLQEHKIFVSEYAAPNDFYSIWEGNLNSYMNAGRSVVATEKLFVHKSYEKKQTPFLF